MSTDLSRRAVVAGAASVPALALPAVAAAAGEPDPIFAAIERWKEASATERAGDDAEEKANDAFKVKYGGYSPSGLSKDDPEDKEQRMDRFWLGTHDRISSHKGRLPARVLAKLHRELNQQEADYKTSVLLVHDKSQEAFEARWAAQQAVFDTVPTTLTGMQAKIDFAMSADYITESLTNTETNEPLQKFLDTLYEAARLMAVQS
jgi:hypothetical protein